MNMGSEVNSDLFDIDQSGLRVLAFFLEGASRDSIQYPNPSL